METDLVTLAVVTLSIVFYFAVIMAVGRAVEGIINTLRGK